MGYWKDIIESIGDGSNPEPYADHYLCPDCFADPGLKALIDANAESNRCTYCERESPTPIAASMISVLIHLNESLQREYDLAANCLPYESREGGYFGETWNTFDLLSDLLTLPNDDDDDTLLISLYDGLGDRTWCRRHPFYLSEQERLTMSWDDFCQVVKHNLRFFFHDNHEDPDENQHAADELYGPAQMLAELAQWCHEQDLARTLPDRTTLYRARYQSTGESLATAAQLGPPPADKATMSNRMSPPGIVMFYVSESPDTALRETVTAEGSFAVAEFRVRRAITILDLGAAAPIPSLFETVPDSLPYDPRVPAIFLNYFATDVSKPVSRDDRQHVEYIPTQIVTEYFRTQFRPNGQRLDGIRYLSARHPGRYSIVLFATQDDVMDGQQPRDGAEPWIELVSHNQVTVTNEDVPAWAGPANT